MFTQRRCLIDDIFDGALVALALAIVATCLTVPLIVFVRFAH